jgi:hypothetical protein
MTAINASSLKIASITSIITKSKKINTVAMIASNSMIAIITMIFNRKWKRYIRGRLCATI